VKEEAYPKFKKAHEIFLSKSDCITQSSFGSYGKYVDRMNLEENARHILAV
jgi:hypothetical protein